MNDLRADIWVDALRRRAESGGAAAFIVRRGDRDAGAVLVKVSLLNGSARLYAPTRDMDGARCWMLPLGEDPVEETRCDAYIARRAEDDPDLWAVEIEDRDGRSFLTEPVANF
jgi:hypothetical protein